MNNTSAFTVIIPAYNEETYLPETLNHLLAAADLYSKETSRPIEMILVDNASTDRTAAIAAESGLKVIREERRQIARARNAGAAHASGEILLFCDADSHLHPRTFLAIADLLKNPRISGGGLRILPDDMTQARSIGLFLWNLISETFVLSGGNLFCRRAIFEEIRGFSEEYYIGEEVIFQMRLKKYSFKKGYRTALLPGCPIVTSMRKITDHGSLQYGWAVFRCFLFPWLAKRKSYCNLWSKVRQSPRGE